MRLVADTIRQNLENQDTLFIFPSEVVAAFWRRQALALTQRRALRSDRFISWDTFKEKAFAHKQKAVPANSFVRLCFAADLLSRNADSKGLLGALVLPAYAESWRPFTRTIARMLPSLKLLLEDERVTSLLNPLLRADLDMVNRLYTEFLESHGFFEPLHEPTFPVAALRGIVFFSSLIADFAEFEPFLDPKAITILTEPEAQAVPLISYPNARVEVKRTCLACRDLLDAGVSPSRIAVTLTKWGGYYEELRDTAVLYDVPLLPRVGKPLADYAEVGIYRLIHECVSSGFSVSALKGLFLNMALPWADPVAGKRLVRFGIDSFGVQNFSTGSGKNDEWRRRLMVAKENGLLDFYRRFKQGAESITGADTFDRLRRGVMAFNGHFLDTSRFSEPQSRSFSTALDLLTRLEETAAHLQDLRIDSPFNLWMMSLADRRYVQPFRGDGIPVYEYRVAAGINPDYHFILGVSQEASAVKSPRYPFLAMNLVPEEIRDAGDFTDSFFRLYENSGSRVTFTSGIEGFDGPASPVERFVSRGTFDEPDVTPMGVDLYRREVCYWAGEGPPPERIHTMQGIGLSFIAETGLREKGPDLTKKAISRPDLEQRVLDQQTTEDGVLRISPTNLDIWTGCRFRYLLYRALRLKEMEFDTIFSSALESGILFHSLFSEVLRGVDGVADTATRATTAAEVFEKVFKSWTGSRFLPPILDDLRRRAEEHVQNFLSVDGEVFPGARVYTLEDTLQVPVAEPDAALYGRIDRISVGDGGYIVVDYKSRLWKKRAGMVTRDGTLVSFQVPVYLLLVEGTYGSVSDALYYDIYKGAYSSVFGGKKPWFDDQERVELLNQTTTAVSRMVKGISASIYTTPGPGEVCEGCDFRAVCREKYRVR